MARGPSVPSRRLIVSAHSSRPRLRRHPTSARLGACLILAGVAAAWIHLAAANEAPFTGTITTLAGTGTAGYLGDGAPAVAARVNAPSGVAVDATGNVYIADSNNNRIRKVAPGGTITTFAGTGGTGFSGDGGLATSATIYSPQDVAVDTSGNVYIADHFNNRIRKVAINTGIITTVAGSGTQAFGGDGGQATAAQLNRPTGVAVDTSGNIYIADQSNHRVRKVTVATGVISTVAGTGTAGYDGDGGTAPAAKLNNPFGVAVDGAGNLFIGDTYNHRVRKVTAGTGIITTVAGTGTAGFDVENGLGTVARLYYPAHVAVDSIGDVYIADQYNQRVRKLAAATGLITTVAGCGDSGFGGDDGQAPAAQLNYPEGVAVAPGGTLYITDTLGHRVRKVTAPSAALLMLTVAGTGTPAYDGDGGPAVAAKLMYPEGVAVDASGNIYIADTSNHRIRKVTAATGIITTYAGTGVAGFAGEAGPATTARLFYPQGLALDSAGNLYVADQYNQRIRKIAVGSGIITTVAGNGTAGFGGDGAQATTGMLNYPTGIAVDGNNNLYIADRLNHRVRKVATGTNILSTLAGDGTAGYLGDGTPATTARLNAPETVAVDAAANVYIADTNNYRIRKVTSGGVITTVAGNGTAGSNGENGPGTSAQLYQPQGVAVDGAGNVYIADHYNQRIRRLNVLTGILSTIAGAANQGFTGDGGAAVAALLNQPAAIAVDAFGSVYIADTYNHRIREAAVPPPALPAIVTQPVSVIVNAGQQVSFTAAANGNPTPTVQWQVSTNNSGIWTNIGGATATTYAFTTTAADNGKLYRAVFTNSAGSTATAAALLTVDSTPVITLNPLSQTVGRTFTVRFTAAATGVPVPFVKWQVSVGGGGFTDIPGATSATYSFAAAFSDNGNQYRAVFSNVVGSTNTSPATLTVINATNTQKGADFNGDDKADIFWRNYATGANMVWEMNGGTRLNTIDLDRIGNINLKVVGLGDFNGDGKVDLVTRNNLTGLSRIYFGNGFGFPTTFDLPLVNDPNWRIVAVADFNGDGMPDLFWRNVATGIDDLWTMNGTAIAINELAETVNDPNWLIVTAGDFDGDGKADLYWRQRGTGVSAIWFMNRATRIGYGTPPTVSDQTWQIVAAADWSGDGRADVLWRNGVTGVNAMWNMNGASMIGYIEPPVLADTNWSPAPISRDPHDFNADGYADLLWLNSVSGVATAWYMNGGARLGDGNPPYVGGSTWQLAGTGDFNGDGKPDFVWRNPSLGWNVVWLMNGLTQIGYVEIENIPGPAWGIAAVADFDGDGKTDIAWRNQVTGDDVIWSMDGVTRIGYTALATVNDPAWHIVGSGDFDGNGSPDLVWRNFATGAETVWYMNGTTFLGSALLEPVADATWHIVAVADYNGDGYPDIVWRNVVSGVNVMWFMNNTTRIGYATITPVGDPTWTIVPNGG